jgi:hypothetical protein
MSSFPLTTSIIFQDVENHQPDISWLYIPFKSISYRDYIPTYGCNHDCLNRPFHAVFRRTRAWAVVLGGAVQQRYPAWPPGLFIHGFVEFSIGYYCSKRNLKNGPFFLLKNLRISHFILIENPRNDHYSCLKLSFSTIIVVIHHVSQKTPPLFFIKNLRVTHFSWSKSPNSTCFITCLYDQKNNISQL